MVEKGSRNRFEPLRKDTCAGENCKLFNKAFIMTGIVKKVKFVTIVKLSVWKLMLQECLGNYSSNTLPLCS